MYSRTQKLKMNTIMSLLNRVAILLSGLILPRLILVFYGSEVNGLVASIKQFLSVITFLDLGVGSVIQAALYKPLAKNDEYQVNVVLTAAKNYFRRISYILVIYVIGLILFFPVITNENFNYFATAFLIIAMSISIFAQYFFGIVNEFLLNANQRSYIQLGAEIVVVILNLITSAFLMIQGLSVQMVTLSASIIYLIRPVYLSYYVNKNYNLRMDVETKKDPLPQKWNGMGQHIAYSIQYSADIVLLTLFSTLENVSIYSIYSMVVQGISTLISSFTGGLTSFFGDLLANDEVDSLNSYFNKIEWGNHTGVVFLYGMTATLILPFVKLYTVGVDDTNYYAPLFSLLIVLAKADFSIRIPYQTVIFSAGHFKQTQLNSYMEALINVGISLTLVNQLGLIGIAIGTLLATVFRTLYLAVYLSKNILHRPIKKFIKQIIVDGVTFVMMILIGAVVINFIPISTFINWIIVALILGIIFFVLLLVINFIFYKKMVIFVFNRITKKG